MTQTQRNRVTPLGKTMKNAQAYLVGRAGVLIGGGEMFRGDPSSAARDIPAPVPGAAARIISSTPGQGEEAIIS